MSEFKYVSRRKTPWTDQRSATQLESFLDSHYQDHFMQRHPTIKSTDEAFMLNSIEVLQCRRCSSGDIVKRGFTANKVQRYFCNQCRSSFNILTNTIFDRHKIPISEWIEFLLYLFGYQSLKRTSLNNKNSDTTTKYWLKKLFLVLEDYQSQILLSGTVYLDEAFYRVRSDEIEMRADGKLFAGLSRNQYCIGIAFDGQKVYLQILGKGQPSYKQMMETFKDHIKIHSELIHDRERTHCVLVEALELSSKAYDGNELKKLKDADNPLNPINQMINLLKKFLNSHSGFHRGDLTGYLNLFAFIINEKGTPLEKVKRMVYLALTKKADLKYRDLYGD